MAQRHFLLLTAHSYPDQVHLEGNAILLLSPKGTDSKTFLEMEPAPGLVARTSLDTRSVLEWLFSDGPVEKRKTRLTHQATHPKLWGFFVLPKGSENLAIVLI